MHDTQVMPWVLNENQDLSLDAVALKYTGIVMDKRIVRSANVPYFTDDNGKLWPLTEYATWPAPVQRQLRDYCLRDVDTTKQLYLRLLESLEETAWRDYWEEEEVEQTGVLLDMECTGIPIDLEANAQLHVELQEERDKQAAKLNDILGYEVNWASPNQIRQVLFEKMFYQEDSIPHGRDLTKPRMIEECAVVFEKPKSKVTEKEWQAAKQALVEQATPPGFVLMKVTPKNLVGYWTRKGLGLKKTTPSKTSKSGLPSTATPELLTLHAGNEFIQELVHWRKINKVITTYTSVFPGRSHGGRLYGRFNQTGTKTGRLSSSGPNLQNIPAHGELGPKVRGLFRGRLLIGDYSQLEPRLMAHFSGDPRLLDAYQSGKDIYIATAEGIFGGRVDKGDPKRQIAKTLVLAMGYGAGPAQIAKVLCLNGYPTTEQTAKGYLNELESFYHVLFSWKEAVIDSAKAKGYVQTLAGRHRRLKSQFTEKWNWKQVGYGERQAVNAVIQGSAGDVVRRLMVNTRHYNQVRLLAQVHDELVWEYEAGLPPSVTADMLNQLRYEGEQGTGFKLNVPLVFEPAYCASWADKGADAPVLFEEEESDDEE